MKNWNESEDSRIEGLSESGYTDKSFRVLAIVLVTSTTVMPWRHSAVPRMAPIFGYQIRRTVSLPLRLSLWGRRLLPELTRPVRPISSSPSTPSPDSNPSTPPWIQPVITGSRRRCRYPATAPVRNQGRKSRISRSSGTNSKAFIYAVFECSNSCIRDRWRATNHRRQRLPPHGGRWCGQQTQQYGEQCHIRSGFTRPRIFPGIDARPNTLRRLQAFTGRLWQLGSSRRNDQWFTKCWSNGSHGGIATRKSSRKATTAPLPTQYHQLIDYWAE